VILEIVFVVFTYATYVVIRTLKAFESNVIANGLFAHVTENSFMYSRYSPARSIDHKHCELEFRKIVSDSINSTSCPDTGPTLKFDPLTLTLTLTLLTKEKIH